MAVPNRYAMGIGVGKVSDLPTLQGARTDAGKFCLWAATHGYKTTPIIDDDKTKVSFAQIRKALTEILENDVDRLLIYFSGHGVGLAQGDYWLLSDCKADGNECINETLSERTARDQPIGQISIMADACRSVIPWAGRISGGNLFLNPDLPVPIQPKVDIFFATRIGAVAQEVAGKDPTKAYGIFSKCLFSALSGQEPGALASGRTPPAVSSQSLADWLADQIPLESGKIPGASVQYPDARHGWGSPQDTYWPENVDATTVPDQFPGGLGGGILGSILGNIGGGLGSDNGGIGGDLGSVIGGSGGNDRAGSQTTGILKSVLGGGAPDSSLTDFLRSLFKNGTADPPPQHAVVNEADRASIAKRKENLAQRVNENHQQILDAAGRESFETAQGFTIIGVNVVCVAARPDGQKPELFLENGNAQIRCFGEPQPLAIELSDGRWIATAALPDFIGTILVNESAVLSLNYAMSKSSPKWQSWMEGAQQEGTDAAARWIALQNIGGTASSNELIAYARQVRMAKHANPTLGILAAYAFDRGRAGTVDLGEYDSADSIAAYFASENGFVPYDVAFLASTKMSSQPLRFHRKFGDTVPVAGSFPLMTQGWALIEKDQMGVHPELLKLRSGLLHGLWTCFRKEEGKRLAGLIAAGDL